ncbi:MAG TPA: DUF983 domain-containing protein [Xanthobacteraceae bacterium]|nr:DUF983 domain-containing protein [Xanthobacteraceae bacterium]
MASDPHARRALWPALANGFRGRCPNCGEGRLFRAYLKVVDRCPVCGEALYHHRADDAPAYFVILIVGHIVVTLALVLDNAYRLPYWMQFAFWLPLTLVLALLLLQPVKGTIVGLQWAYRMHGFDPNAGQEPESFRQ